MKITSLAGFFLACSLGAIALPALADTSSAPAAWAQHKAEWQAHRAHRMDARIERIATMLQLTDAQKSSSAWKNYAQAMRDLTMRAEGQKHDMKNADAATLTRVHADMATRFAGKLSTLADATRTFEASLTAAQRKAFDEMVRQESMRFMHHGMHGMRGMDRDSDK